LSNISHKKYAEDLKIKPNEIVGKTDHDFFPKKLAEKYRADDKRIMESGKIEDIEEEYIQDGQKVFVHTAKTPVKDENGHVIGVLGIFWDITEQKKSEEALKESEERFRAIFDSAKDGVLVADIETKKFCLGNKAICKMMGYGQEDIKNLGLRDIHYKEDFPQAIEQFEMQSKREIEVSENRPIKRRDGSVVYADISTFPFISKGKTFLAGIFRDVTERKQMEEERFKLATEKQRIYQLEKFAKVAVGRELKMIEMKKQIGELESKLKVKISENG
jgi:PAS domain S-box-containing protein